MPNFKVGDLIYGSDRCYGEYSITRVDSICKIVQILSRPSIRVEVVHSPGYEWATGNDYKVNPVFFNTASGEPLSWDAEYKGSSHDPIISKIKYLENKFKARKENHVD